MIASVSAGVVGLTLLVAGLAKLVNPARFRETLARMLNLPRAAGRVTSVALPVIEVGLAVMLLLGLAIRVAAAAAALLFLIFSAVIAAILLRRQQVVCACFGSASRQPVRPTALARNGLLTACSVIAAAATSPPATRLPGTLCAALLLISAALLLAYRHAISLIRQVSVP